MIVRVKTVRFSSHQSLLGEGGGLVGQTLFKRDCPPNGAACEVQLQLFDAQGQPIPQVIINDEPVLLPEISQLNPGQTDLPTLRRRAPISPVVAVLKRSGGCARIQGSYETFSAQGEIIESYNASPATALTAASLPEFFGSDFARGVTTQHLGSEPQRRLGLNVYNPDPQPTDAVFVGSQRSGQEFFVVAPANTSVTSAFFDETFTAVPDPLCTEIEIGMQLNLPPRSLASTQGTTERKVYVTLISVVVGGANFQFKPVPLEVVER